MLRIGSLIEAYISLARQKCEFNRKLKSSIGSLSSTRDLLIILSYPISVRPSDSRIPRNFKSLSLSSAKLIEALYTCCPRYSLSRRLSYCLNRQNVDRLVSPCLEKFSFCLLRNVNVVVCTFLFLFEYLNICSPCGGLMFSLV